MNQWASIPLALGGAVFLSAGTILQWLGHERHGRANPIAWRVSGQPLWWTGIACSGLGTICFYAALWVGMISMVQPLSSLHIALTAVGMGWLRKEAVLGYRAWGISMVAVGVLACLVGEVGKESAAPPDLLGAAAFLGLIAVLGLAALRLPRVADRLAVWSGSVYSISAVAWKAVADLGVSLPGLVAGMLFGATYVMGFVLMQAAFRRGGAGAINASASGVATALPMAAAVWVFAEPVGWMTWAGIALIATGVVLSGARRGSVRGVFTPESDQA